MHSLGGVALTYPEILCAEVPRREVIHYVLCTESCEMKSQGYRETNRGNGTHDDVIYYSISLLSKAVQFCLGLYTVTAAERLQEIKYEGLTEKRPKDYIIDDECDVLQSSISSTWAGG